MLKYPAQAGPVGAQRLIGAVAAALAWSAMACEGPPARSRPWRHPEPTVTEPAASLGSPQAMAQARADLAKKREHSLRIRLDVEPSHLLPLVDPEVDTLRVAEDTIFETLVRWEAGPAGSGPGTLRPGLAESWRVLGGGSEIRLTLRDGVPFHDGHKFDVVDAQWSLDVARSPTGRSPRLREALADVATVEILGPREVRILLRRPSGYALRTLAEVPMLPQHVYGGGALDRGVKNRAFVGTGPYRLARWDKHERIVLAKNETYWGSPPAIDEIEFVIEPDAARALMRARRGEIDVIPELSPAHFPGQAQAMSADFRSVRLGPPSLIYLVPNSQRPAFADPRCREALALLVDREHLVRETFHGLARVVAGPIWPGGPGDGPSGPAPGFDPTRAARLLDQCGWPDSDGDSLRDRGGERLRVAMLAATDGTGGEVRDVIVPALRKAGFVVEVLAGEPAVLLNRLKSGSFDLAVVEWRGRVDEDLAPLFASRGTRNWGGTTSPAMDVALAAVAATQDPGTRAVRLAEVVARLAVDWPIVPIVAPDPVALVHRRVQGLVPVDGWFRIRALSLLPGELP
jgi:peptide/nickel transport system substrate-binding protein